MCGWGRGVSVQGLGVSVHGGISPGADPPMDRQTPVKTLPSLAVGNDEMHTSF